MKFYKKKLKMKKLNKTNNNKSSIINKSLKTIGGFWFKYIKLPLSNFWYLNFKKPYLDKKEAKLKAKETQAIKDAFSNTFGDYNEVKTLMYNKPFKQTDYVVLNEDLVNNRKEMIRTNTTHTPFLFEPEIIDIHNENLNPKAPTLEYLIKLNNESAHDELRKQEIKENSKLNPTKPIKSYKDKTNVFNDVYEYEKSDKVSLQTIRKITGDHANEKFKSFIKTLDNAKEIIKKS